MLERRLLSAAIVDQIFTDTGMPTDLAHAPQGGGWQGQPNLDASNFVAYAVVTPQTATLASGPLSDPQADRLLPYAISSFGVSPVQTEWMADKARAAVEALKKTHVVLGDATYTIQQVRTDVIGGLMRVDSTEPAYWGQVDVLTLWITR
jgi:hypothetical protein